MTSYYNPTNTRPQLFNGLPDPRFELDQGAISEPESPPGSVPLPNEDFEPFFSDYANYDAALEHSLQIQSLSIAQPLPPGVTTDETAAHNIAKYAEYDYGLSLPPMLSSSPVKPEFGEVSPRHLAPVGLDMPPSSPPGPDMSPVAMRRADRAPHYMPLGISHIPLSPPAPPPRMAQLVPQSPPDGALRTSMYTHSSPIRPSSLQRVPEEYSPELACSSPPPYMLSDHSPLMLGSPSRSVEWQPILTIPENKKCEEIIRSQIKSTLQKTRRKSCLPPGAVDEYMGAADEDSVFRCLYPHCNRLFRRRYNLRSHIQTHLCDRPYSCDVCDATFVRPHDLRRHQRGHSTARPFICPCGKGFTRMDALQRHRHRNICEGGIAKTDGVDSLGNSPNLDSEHETS